MCKYSDGVGRYYANRAKGVAPEFARIVIDAVWGHNVGASATNRASRGCANVGKEPYTVAVNRQEYACKPITG